MEFRYSGLFVRDVPSTVAFYQRAFGLSLRYMHPSNGYAELETGATLLAFVSEAFIEKADLLGPLGTRPNRPDLEPIAAQVAFVTDDIDRDSARAIAAGAVVIKQPPAKPWASNNRLSSRSRRVHRRTLHPQPARPAAIGGFCRASPRRRSLSSLRFAQASPICWHVLWHQPARARIS